MKKALRETQTLRAGCIKADPKNFRPAADPLPGGKGRPKFNQLEKVTHYLHLQTKFGQNLRTQFRVIVVTDAARPPSVRPPATDRTDYNTLRRYASRAV